MYNLDFKDTDNGFKSLVDGYIDYSKEVIKNRALPDLRDGLKPVTRRIIVTLDRTSKEGQKIKCQTFCGKVLDLHPHGDVSVYSAAVLMTDRNGSLQVPLLAGRGNLGGVCTTTSAAAPRYTEAGLHRNAYEYLGEMNGIDMIPNYDSTTNEPNVLPVSFPAVLCNCVSGIAVGFKSNIPSFNFNDVLDLTLEYVDTGKCTKILYPDFSTGGYYIENKKELEKLMHTGKAKLKLRGKMQIVDKEITVTEFPFGKTIQGVLSQIDKANIQGIKDSGNVEDFDHGTGLLINCSAKNKVDGVVYALYKDTDLQCNFSADMTMILNDEPVTLGVYSVIEKWVEWRRKVLEKEYSYNIRVLNENIKFPKAFMEVINGGDDKISVLLETIHKEGIDAGIKYVLANYNNDLIDYDLAKQICNRRVPEFHKGGKYLEKYNSLLSSINLYEGYLVDLNKVIHNQLLRLKNTYGSEHPRKTEITTTDYNFESSDMQVKLAKDTTGCIYSFKNGFLKKMKYNSTVDKDAYEFDGIASDTLIALDNRGRVLRVYCEDLPYNGIGELGVYLPRYFGLEEKEDYRIYWIGVLDGTTKTIIYKDGNVGFLDTSEWYGVSRKVRVLEKGIATSVADKVGAVIDTPEWLFVVDSEGKIGYEIVSNIKKKDRTAKTRVFNLTKGTELCSYISSPALNGAVLISNIGRYRAPKLQYLETSESFLGDNSQFHSMY